MCVRQRLLFDLGADVKKKNEIRYIGIGEMPTRLKRRCYESASKMSRSGESISNMENSLTFCEPTEKTYRAKDDRCVEYLVKQVSPRCRFL